MKARSGFRFGVALSGVLFGLAAGVSQAHAESPFAPTAAGGAARPVAPTRSSAGTVATSQYLGGYVIAPGEGLASDSSTFRLPTHARCSGYNDLYIGELLNNAAGDMFQPGGENQAAAVVVMACEPGEGLGYSLTAYTIGGGLNYLFTASAGDTIETRVALTQSGQTVAEVIDDTNGKEAISSGPSHSGAHAQFYEGVVPDPEWEAQSCDTGPCAYDIPQFGSIRFTRSQVNGLPLSQVDPTAEALDQDGPVQLVPSVASSHPGSFTLNEKHDN
jgi:hypothetical protein